MLLTKKQQNKQKKLIISDYNFWIIFRYCDDVLVQALHLKDGSTFNLPLIFEHLLWTQCYNFCRRLSYCQHVCDKYRMAILQDLLWLMNCVCCIQVFIIDVDVVPLSPFCRECLSRFWSSFSSPLMSLPLTPDHLRKAISRGNQHWVPLIRLP